MPPCATPRAFRGWAMLYPKIIRIFNSQFVEYMWISEALAEELPENVEILSGPEALSFDSESNLTDRFPRQRGQRNLL